MNLRRILQGFTLCLFVAFFANSAQAQAQLAGVNEDGLIQLGANHPFVVSTYEFSMAPLNVTNAIDANDKLQKYIDEGFINFTYDFGNSIATMTIDASKIADVQLTVAQMNEKLKMIHRIRR
jgi:hypothetical protein